MNVFVLSTGRTGSHTFAKACEHVVNFTSSHEGRFGKLGHDRLAYPDQHIAVDSRLCWFLGELDRKYGDEAYYVHLDRERSQVAASYVKRWHGIGHIAPVYRDTIVNNPNLDRLKSSTAMIETMNANIDLFLKDKTNVMRMRLETVKASFPEFWRWIGAEGDLEAAMVEWSIKHGASLPPMMLAAKSIKARTGKVLRAAFPK